MTRPLYPYQIEGAKWLASRRVAAIGDDPGLGKTIQAIHAVDVVAYGSVISGLGSKLPVLIVTSAVARVAWQREMKHSTGYGKTWTAEIMSWDQLSRMEPKDAKSYAILIFDEAHYIKTPQAKRTKVAFALAARASYDFSGVSRVWMLSGTLMPNHPGELWVPARLYDQFSAPAIYEAAALFDFPASRQPEIDKAFDDPEAWTELWCNTRQTTYGTQVLGAKRGLIPNLRKFMQRFVLRRRKAEVLTDLPPLSILEHRLPLDVLAPDARAGMKDASVQIAARILQLDPMADTSDKSDALAEGEALRRLIADEQFSTARRLLGEHKADACADWINDELEAGEPKVVVFAHHREVLKRLADRLRGHGHDVMMIDGSTPLPERGRIVDRFQNDPDARVLVGQLKAAGTGITLTASKLAVIVEPSTVPADNLQAFCRVHRIGTKDGARGVFLSVDGTMDANLIAAQWRKTRDAEALLD